MPPLFYYGVYGVYLESEIPLCLPEKRGSGPAQIRVTTTAPEVFSLAIVGVDLIPRADWYQYAHLPDGSSYVRWLGLGEFLVSSDGTHIQCYREPAASIESFQVYLLGQALSFALVKSGSEPLHGTAVVINETHKHAVCFLGDSGYGKSTLAASFLAAGHSLLTDDLLLLRPSHNGLLAYPGPPRIKLFPKIARRFLESAINGVPMNAGTKKHVIPLDGSLNGARRHQQPVPLRSIYVLAPPSEMRHQRCVRIEPMPPRDAFLALIANTFNRYLTDSPRLQRQLAQTTRLWSTVPVKKLSYPRNLERLPEVRAAILADCASLTQFTAPFEPRPRGADPLSQFPQEPAA